MVIENGILSNVTIPNNLNSPNNTYYVTKVNGFVCLFKNNIRHLVDTRCYVFNYCKRIVGNYYENCLILGLGLGILPYYMSEFCENIDVLEIDKELVDYISSLSYLGNKVNIITSNAIDYKSNFTYDIIISDIHAHSDSPFKQEKMQIIANYQQNIKTGGFIYFPIDDTFLSNY